MKLEGNPNGAFDELRTQILIALAKRLVDKQGTFQLSAAEIDGTAQYMLTAEVDTNRGGFKFKLSKKS